jgi:hypothetical protein
LHFLAQLISQICAIGSAQQLSFLHRNVSDAAKTQEISTFLIGIDEATLQLARKLVAHPLTE